ncbi:MAG: ATP-dependent Clp protease adaptor ClpS [Phycisphaerales bacterium]
MNAETAGTSTLPRPQQPPPRVDELPPFKVILHNDDHNDMLSVIMALMEVAKVAEQQAMQVMLEAHRSGVALVRVTHKEHAELIVDGLKSKNLTSTMEAA